MKNPPTIGLYVSSRWGYQSEARLYLIDDLTDRAEHGGASQPISSIHECHISWLAAACSGLTCARLAQPYCYPVPPRKTRFQHVPVRLEARLLAQPFGNYGARGETRCAHCALDLLASDALIQSLGPSAASALGLAANDLTGCKGAAPPNVQPCQCFSQHVPANVILPGLVCKVSLASAAVHATTSRRARRGLAARPSACKP